MFAGHNDTVGHSSKFAPRLLTLLVIQTSFFSAIPSLLSRIAPLSMNSTLSSKKIAPDSSKILLVVEFEALLWAAPLQAQHSD
jgi:hypothetical protein